MTAVACTRLSHESMPVTSNSAAPDQHHNRYDENIPNVKLNAAGLQPFHSFRLAKYPLFHGVVKNLVKYIVDRSDKFSRRQLGIPDDAFVFISCANGMKHVPERDFIWTEILRLISHAYILIKPFSPWDYDREMVERIKQAARLAGAPDRIRYIGGCDSHNEVFSLLALADAQLDTYPFNGWTTTIEAFCLALPTVTQEGNGYRSRLGAGFLRAMGIKEGIAQDETGYIQWAVRFATEPTLCNWIRNRIKANREHLLFNNRALQMEYEKALIELVRK